MHLLLAKGASVNITDGLGETALTCATKYGYGGIAHFFLTNGAKLDIEHSFI